MVQDMNGTFLNKYHIRMVHHRHDPIEDVGPAEIFLQTFSDISDIDGDVHRWKRAEPPYVSDNCIWTQMICYTHHTCVRIQN